MLDWRMTSLLTTLIPIGQEAKKIPREGRMMGNKKAKTDKGWAGHKLFGHTFSQRDIRTPEDKYQDAVLANLEEAAAKKPKKKKK